MYQKLTTFAQHRSVFTEEMSFAGFKRPGGGGGGGALVHVKRPRQELVAASGDARSRQLVLSVSGASRRVSK